MADGVTATSPRLLGSLGAGSRRRAVRGPGSGQLQPRKGCLPILPVQPAGAPVHRHIVQQPGSHQRRQRRCISWRRDGSSFGPAFTGSPAGLGGGDNECGADLPNGCHHSADLGSGSSRNSGWTKVTGKPFQVASLDFGSTTGGATGRVAAGGTGLPVSSAMLANTGPGGQCATWTGQRRSAERRRVTATLNSDVHVASRRGETPRDPGL